MNLHVFVYGSLKQGFHNHRYLVEDECLGSAVTEKDYTLISLGSFPGLIEDKPKDQIQGEVYFVSEATLKRLDGLEGHPVLYERKEIEVYLYDFQKWVKAWCYFFKRNYREEQVVDGGIWVGDKPHAKVSAPA